MQRGQLCGHVEIYSVIIAGSAIDAWQRRDHPLKMTQLHHIHWFMHTVAYPMSRGNRSLITPVRWKEPDLDEVMGEKTW